MNSKRFYDLLLAEICTYKQHLETDDEEWKVKGFIDVDKNIYTISHDTKVVSKIIEIILIPKLKLFAEKNGLELELPDAQNYYPDLTFKDKQDGNLFAVDFKTTYYEVTKNKKRDEEKKIKGMTLGAFSGYFRDRNSTKNIQHPYHEYKSHLVLGIVYRQAHATGDEFKVYGIDELGRIKSVIKSFIFFLQPKYKIAIDHPGSGNTKNIGGIADLEKMVNGQGPFVQFGDKAEEVFDDYWINYRTAGEAKADGKTQPDYTDLESYLSYKKEVVKKNNSLFGDLFGEEVK